VLSSRSSASTLPPPSPSPSASTQPFHDADMIMALALPNHYDEDINASHYDLLALSRRIACLPEEILDTVLSSEICQLIWVVTATSLSNRERCHVPHSW
jgi:hypothetical protein